MASVPFNNLITFSRGSNATVTGSNGLIQWAPNNLLTSSQSFNVSGWNVDGAVITRSTGVAPDGTTTATSIAVGTGNNRVYQFDNSGSLGNKVFSLYVKAGVGSTVTITPSGAINPITTATVNASTGAVSGLAGASVASVGDGWYRVSIPVNVLVASGNSTFWVISATGGAVFIWGAQLELGSAATTYNSTTVKNLLGFSEAFDNAAWTKSDSSIVTGAQANPVNGAFNAQKLMENTATSQHYIQQNFTTISGTSYTFSILAKAAGRDFVVLSVGGAFAANEVWFNLATGAAGSIVGAVVSSAISSFGNGWYRCSITVTATSSGNGITYPKLAATNGSNSYLGDGNSGVYIYGAQLSDSASLDPYVPTPAAAPSSTAYYGPRFDYDPVTLQPKGLLVEEARTNLLLRSQDASVAPWSFDASTGSGVTLTGGLAPDGVTQFAVFNEGTSNSAHRANQGTSVVAGTTYTFSAYIKAGTSRYILVGSNSGGMAIDTQTWTVTETITAANTTTTNVTLVNVGGGVYRASVSVAHTTNTSVFFVVSTSTSATPGTMTPAFTGTSRTAIFTFCQFEAGAFATSYIPTVASTVTRSADVATINGSLFSQWYGQTEGSWVSSFAPYVVPGGVVAQISAATNNDRFQLLADSAGQIAVSAGGAGQGTIDAGTVAAGATNNLAYAYRTNDTAASLSGGAAVADTTVTLPVVDRLCLGATVTPAGFLNGHIRSIDYIPARAADFQLQALTL